jgi:phospholipid transport system transporter-binding protein
LSQPKAFSAAFEMETGERSRVTGALHFSTVSALLEPGAAAISEGRAAVIDLSTVSESDSSGLALLIEWLSVAKSARRSLRYENISEQIQELARLSDVEGLLTRASEAPPATDPRSV